MSVKKRDITKTAALVVVLAFFSIGLLSRCASVAAPQGGPKDSLPPKVVAMTPAYGTTNFKGKRIYIEFDEYVQLKDQQKEFYTSPFMKKKPSVVLRGRGVQIDLQEDLDSNRTYALNFGSSVCDNNEAIPYTGLRYVFSTGDHIDSLVMSGYTVDAMSGDTVGNVYILFYDAAVDSIPDYDSTLFKATPVCVARSFPNGIFIAENLKPADYRIYALEDNNGNQTYEPGADRVAFLDTVYNPERQQPFEIWYDTVRKYMQADPQLQFRVFMDKPYRRQTFLGAQRPLGNKVFLSFMAPQPEISELTFEGCDTIPMITEYMNSKHDSIVLWFDAAAETMPDTLRGRMIFKQHDSLMRLVADTQNFKLGWRAPKKKEDDKKKKKEDEPEPNPFKVQVAGGATLNPEKDIVFKFDYPLKSLDTVAIVLEKLPGEEGGGDTVRVPFTFVQDTLKIREWAFSASWEVNQKYRLTIPAGTFVNTNRESNDTLRSEFTIESPDKYATLELNIKGKTPESEYIVQVLNMNGGLIKEVAHLRSGTHKLQYIEVGSVKIRLIEDLNGNGKWDSGVLVERKQPERVEMFVDENNSEEIVTKENWELVFDVDMNQIFAPVTMERMQNKIERDNLKMLQERMEKREEAAKKNNSGSSGSGGIGIGSGMGSMNQLGGSFGL